MIDALGESRQIALTTVAADDSEYCDRLQTSLVRGSHELLYWGAGPRLYRGDIVALFTPKSKYLPPSEHSCVRRLYFVEADSTDGSHWNQHVFLSRRVNLDRPITHEALLKKVGLTFRQIVSAGSLPNAMSPEVKANFLREVALSCNDGLSRLLEMARGAEDSPKLCISYSGHDWTQAQRLKLWLDAAGLMPFFVSPVGEVLPHEEGPLTTFLQDTFSAAALVLCLVPAKENVSRWIQLEIDAAVRSNKPIIFVTPDPERPSIDVPRAGNVQNFKLETAQEGRLVALVKKELSALGALAKAGRP